MKSIHLINLINEKSKVILQEQSKTYLDINDDFFFLPDNSFLWTSEKDGYNHIYIYTIDGQEIRQITNGEWEITEFYGYNQKTKTLYYQSTEKSPLQRDIYSINVFGKKKKLLSEKRGSNNADFSKNYKYSNVNLDIDFSVSKGGYRLRPHRDDITRLYNFLIYLTDIPRKNGGSLTIYKKKAKKNIRKSFKRLKSFTPKKGTVVFFQSTPNSYHGVKRFIEKNCPKRFFIYGSYAQNTPVIWKYKDATYYPHIIYSKKRMLTSFHDANYLTSEPKY